MTLRPLRLFAFVAALALVSGLLLGCGSSGDDASPSPSSSAAAEGEVMMRAIAEGQFEGVDMKPVAVAIAESENVAGGYFVAVKFDSSEGEQVGVWATKFLDASSMIWAVDDVAGKTTQWPLPSSSGDDDYSMDDPGAQEALNGVE
jgi:hypothetical protein